MCAALHALAAADSDVLRWLATHRSPVWNRSATLLMHLGLSAPFLAACLAAALFLALRLRAVRPAAAGCAAALTATVLSLALKHVIARHRPPSGLAIVQASGYSMPSTAAALVAAITAAVLVSAPWVRPMVRRIAVVAVLAINLVTGTALVYLGVHWTTDVLAGWALGAAVAVPTGLLGRTRKLRPTAEAPTERPPPAPPGHPSA